MLYLAAFSSKQNETPSTSRTTASVPLLPLCWERLESATLAARTFLQEAIERGGVRGPYGDVCASGHAAYLYEMRHEDDIDRYASLFVANAEAASLLIVPVAGLRADSILTASTPHGTIALRDKIGYMRVQAIQQKISR